MKHRIDGNPDYGDLTVELEPDETILVESGAMSRMGSDLELKTRLPGGFLSGLARKFLGGESFFLGEYRSAQGGWLSLSPSTPGMVMHRRLEGDHFLLTAGSFLACTDQVQIRTKFGGMRSLFSKEGAFLIECSGHGDLFFNSYGAILERELDGTLIVDNGHLVGWEPSLDYRIRGAGGIKQTLFSGEGLTMEFSGKGRLYLQTRTMPETASWLTGYLRG